MADLNALIAQGYQSQPLPDPFVQYSKMQQLENSATQNRLAQQNMQENAQMAPLRMREMEARVNTSNLTYDQAKGAQDFITGVMQKAKENGSDVSDPMDAAKQMLMHPNPTVQGMGKHLAEAYQLIQGIEQQQRYLQSMASPTGLAAPAAAPTAAYMPTSAQGTFGGPTPAMPSALGSGTFDVNAPAPVANALAPTAPAVNALRPGAVTAESVADQIRQGNAEFGNAPGWAKDRELLFKQYEALLNPRQRTFAPIDASKYTPESIRAFNVSGDQSDLVAKEKSDKAVANINAADYTPTSVQAFSVSGDYADLVPKEKPIAKSDFDKLLDESGLSDPEKQVMRIAKLHKETAKPEQKAEARSEFEKLLDNSDLTEDQKAEARRAKITKETARPESRPETRSEFEKLLDNSNMTEQQKAEARRAKIAKETASPADRPEARSEFEKLLDASNMTESQKTAARRAKITKESTTAAAGGQGKPPSGYRYDASGENLEVIPGGPADKQEKQKPIPPNINTAIATNDMSIKRIEDALDLLKKNPDAIGLKNLLPGQALDRADPKGVATRSAIGDIGSLVIHDRSGAAVTQTELQRLGFIPTPTDRSDNAKTKLETMLKWAKMSQQGLSETYSADQGYKPSPTLAGKNKAAPANVSNW